MSITLDHVAIVGYSCLLLFTITQIHWTWKSPADLVGTALLVLGLGSLIAYHANILKSGATEKNNKTQKNLRLVAHASITAFLLITLTSASEAKFQFYDAFALAAHALLFVMVLSNSKQLLGVVLLAAYFGFASINTAQKSGVEMLNLLGRVIMTVFFVSAATNAVKEGFQDDDKVAMVATCTKK